MNCVKCDGKLRILEVDDIQIDQCDCCFGIWFDSGELQRVLGKKSIERFVSMAKRNIDDDTKRGNCPRCKGLGKLVQVASIKADLHIDTCSVCGGQWLDGGELDLLRDRGALRRILDFFRKIV